MIEEREFLGTLEEKILDSTAVEDNYNQHNFLRDFAEYIEEKCRIFDRDNCHVLDICIFAAPRRSKNNLEIMITINNENNYPLSEQFINGFLNYIYNVGRKFQKGGYGIQNLSLADGGIN